MLVVIAIIGVLVAMLLPAVQAAREAARRSSCSNNLKQLGIALHNYHDTYKTLPPDGIWHGNPRGTQPDATTARCYTWIALILPFMEQQPLHSAINFSMPANNQVINGVPLREIAFESLHCPSDIKYREPPHGWGVTSYAANGGWDHHRRSLHEPQHAGVFSLMDAIRLDDIKDGTSNTMMVAETTMPALTVPGGVPRWNGGAGQVRVGGNRIFRTALVAPNAWLVTHVWVTDAGKGPILDFDGVQGTEGTWKAGHTAPHAHMPKYVSHWLPNSEWPGAASFHPGGAQFCLADASVRFIPNSISAGSPPGDSMGRFGNIYAAMHTPAGHRDQAIVTFD